MILKSKKLLVTLQYGKHKQVILMLCLFLGYGSSAIVYKAIYKPLNRRMALKMIDLDKFERNQIDELRVSC